MSIITEGEVPMPMHNPPHPGLTVRHDCLEPLGLTVTEGAKVLGVTRQALNNLVNGKAGISPEMAVRLAKAFGTTPETWLRLQMAYDLAQVRQQDIRVKRVSRRALTDDLHP
jgi:addiction module HigA family antidote